MTSATNRGSYVIFHVPALGATNKRMNATVKTEQSDLIAN